jgi:hypothetical protein
MRSERSDCPIDLTRVSVSIRRHLGLGAVHDLTLLNGNMMNA